MSANTKHLCGCLESATAWLKLCDTHAAEVAALHNEHAANMAARRARDMLESSHAEPVTV